MARAPHFTNHWSSVIFGRYFIQIRAERPTDLTELRKSFQANVERVSQITPWSLHPTYFQFKIHQSSYNLTQHLHSELLTASFNKSHTNTNLKVITTADNSNITLVIVTFNFAYLRWLLVVKLTDIYYIYLYISQVKATWDSLRLIVIIIRKKK
jgi:hypothetical protein